MILNGPRTKRLPGNLSIAFEGINSIALVGEVGPKLAFSVGSACTSEGLHLSHVLEALGLPLSRITSTIRIGVGRFNTLEEIETAVDILVDAVRKLRK